MRKKTIIFMFLGLVLCSGAFLFLKDFFWPAKPDIILITAASLRPDHLSCYGYEHINTAAIDELAKGAVLFKNVFSGTPNLSYSYASILTGKTATSVISRAGQRLSIDSSYKLLSEYLKEQGYSTAAVVSDPFLAQAAQVFKKGFDVYENSVEKITEKAVEIFAKLKENKKPVFIWIQYSIPEYPYNIPKSFEKSKNDFIYDRQVLELDAEIAKLLAGLKQFKLAKKALTIFTAGSGEGLDEHKEPGHGIFLYNSTLKVPLVIKFPKAHARGKNTELVSFCDIAPTILDAVGVDYAENAFDGRSLSQPREVKIDGVRPRIIYLESLTGYDDYGWSPLVGLIANGHKYIEAPQPELYDLLNDPYELKNIIGENKAKALEMQGQLMAYLKDKRPLLPDILNKGFDPKDKIEVARPYLLSGGNADTLINLYRGLLDKDSDNKKFLFNLGDLYFRLNKPEMAQSYLLRLTRRYPDYNEAWELLGLVYERQNDTEEAAKCYQKALSIYPYMPISLNNLSIIYLKERKLEEALKCAQTADELSPNTPNILDTLAQVNFKLGNKEKAVALLEKAIALAPKSENFKTRLKEIKNKR